MQKPRILVVGVAGTEMVLKTPFLPTAGESAAVDSFHFLPGGGGTALSVALARLGSEPVLSAHLGGDPNAKELTDYLRSEGIDTRFLTEEPSESTALDVILREERQSDRRLRYAGASERFRSSDVEEAFLCYPDAVILHRGLPGEVNDEAVACAERRQLPLIVASLPDPARYTPSRFGACELLVVDSDDAERCTGIRPIDQEKCMKACMALTNRIKAKYVVLRLGERGVFLYDGMYYDFIAAYDVPQPNGVSSEHAFTAALVLEYLRSEGEVKRACEFASIVSAVYLTRGGGLRAYPTDEDVRRFIDRNEIDFILS